jgi:hypothetical protein
MGRRVLVLPGERGAVHPAGGFLKGKSDPGFRANLQIASDPAIRAQAVGLAFRAVAANSASGDQDGFHGELAEAGLAFVMDLRPRRGTWAHGADARTPVDAAANRAGAVRTTPATGGRSPYSSATGTPRPGGPPTRRWAGVGRTTHGAWQWQPPTLPPKATWYLVTSPPRRPAPGWQPSPGPAAG